MAVPVNLVQMYDFSGKWTSFTIDAVWARPESPPKAVYAIISG